MTPRLPRLVAIAGPLEGTTLSLNSAEIGIGRELSNQVYLNDPLVSRRHCLLNREGDSFVLRDQDSSNGTMVNNVPVHERLLEEGDRIQVGGSLFLFLTRASEPTPQDGKLQFDENPVVTQTAIRLQQDEAVYLHPDKVTALPASERLARDLNALLKISLAISRMQHLDELQQQLLDLIFAVIPAQFGAILLDRDYFPKIGEVVWLERQQRRENPPPISRTVIDQVLKDRKTLLCKDVTEAETLRGVSSLILSQVRSLLVVPLVLYDQSLGVIYLDSKDESALFDEDHLQLLTAIAGIAAVTFDNVRRWERLEGETHRLQEEIKSSHGLKHGMIGESEAMRGVYKMIQKLAPAESTALIRGESGTGKEIAARAIHQLSSRRNQPFIAVNCAALTESLLASQLFGHKRGAFTGAVSDQAGVFEEANSGTLFLDEIGDIPPTVQLSLLRALQERVITRLGESRPRKVDVRIIAATNRPLEELISQGSFRADLYYRLNVVQLVMPSLRDRRSDIMLLAQYFVMRYSQQCKRPVKGLAPETRALLIGYDWPGNVRELENAIERAIVLGSTEWILPEDLPESVVETALPANAESSDYHAAVKEAKRQIIYRTFQQASGSYPEAAKLLGLHPNNLYRLVRDLGLKELLKK